MIPRADYMSGKVPHDEYFGQFVTPALRNCVVNRIGVERILDSKDPHLNDIPLRQWDALHALLLAAVPKALRDDAGENNSLGFTVCVAKVAARLFQKIARQ